VKIIKRYFKGSTSIENKCKVKVFQLVEGAKADKKDKKASTKSGQKTKKLSYKTDKKDKKDKKPNQQAYYFQHLMRRWTKKELEYN
jgi:hypothetical protein